MRLLSAVSGGAVTATLFHSHVQCPEIPDEISLKVRKEILVQYEKEGYPYDWQSFETKLLEGVKQAVV